jgi:twitching motility protein PilU
MIGEIRDMDTMKHAINYAETGHLCLATLHANNANQAIDRILNFFPEMAHRQILMDLSMNLRSIVSQRLIAGVDNKQVPAVEVLISTPYISELIMKGNIGDIKDAMKDSSESGMVTFDEALIALYNQGKITLEEAVHNADSKNDLSLAIRMGVDTQKDGGADSDSTELILG